MTKETKKWLMYGVGGVVVLLILRAIINAVSKSTGPTITTNNNTTPVKPKYVCDPSNAKWDVSISQGKNNSPEVCYLQTWLNTYYNSKISVDGDFGPNTRKALDKTNVKMGISFTLTDLANTAKAANPKLFAMQTAY